MARRGSKQSLFGKNKSIPYKSHPFLPKHCFHFHRYTRVSERTGSNQDLSDQIPFQSYQRGMYNRTVLRLGDKGSDFVWLGGGVSLQAWGSCMAGHVLGEGSPGVCLDLVWLGERSS